MNHVKKDTVFLLKMKQYNYVKINKNTSDKNITNVHVHMKCMKEIVHSSV